MNRKTATLAVVIAVAVVALSAVLFIIQPQGSPLPTQTEPQLQTVYYNESTVFRIDGSGNAEAEWAMEISPSTFTDLTILPITGGTMGGTTVHGIGVENAKLMFLSSLQSSYSYYGFEMESASCDIDGLQQGGSFRINAKWSVPRMAYRQYGKWILLVEPVDEVGYAQHTLNSIKELQANISIVSKMISGGCQLIDTYSTTYVLPNGAEISNPDDLVALNYSVDFGGGTIEYDSAYVSDVNGAPAVVTEGQITVGDNLISITEEEFLAATKSAPIEYTGVPSPRNFVDSVSWVTVDMKFGRERSLYTISLDGTEFDVSPYQLLYYSAKELAALAEGSSAPLLAGDQPIQVALPDSESGEWDSFLKVLTMDDLATLARDVCDSIDSTGKVPNAIASPIGNLRSRDALFTFLRAISFYQEHGNLPDELVFAPAPTGNLVKSGVEVPANLVYFTLGEKYVVTGTPRMDQIISDLRQPNFNNSRFAENICGWVYQKIAYQLILGWFTSEEVLDMNVGKCLDKANLYMAITRTAGMPTRRITGFLLFDPAQLGPTFLDIAGVTPDGKYIVGHAWTEVYVPGEGWLFADPTAGRFKMGRYDVELYSKVEETWQEVLASYETSYGKLI